MFSFFVSGSFPLSALPLDDTMGSVSPRGVYDTGALLGFSWSAVLILAFRAANLAKIKLRESVYTRARQAATTTIIER